MFRAKKKGGVPFDLMAELKSKVCEATLEVNEKGSKFASRWVCVCQQWAMVFKGAKENSPIAWFDISTVRAVTQGDALDFEVLLSDRSVRFKAHSAEDKKAFVAALGAFGSGEDDGVLAQPEEPAMGGVLKKKGEGLMGGWKKRYFTQSEDELFYYKSQGSGQSPLGRINLNRITRVVKLGEPKHAFQVDTEGVEYLLQADGSDEAAAWIEAFEYHYNKKTRKFKHEEGQKPPSDEQLDELSEKAGIVMDNQVDRMADNFLVAEQQGNEEQQLLWLYMIHLFYVKREVWTHSATHLSIAISLCKRWDNPLLPNFASQLQLVLRAPVASDKPLLEPEAFLESMEIMRAPLTGARKAFVHQLTEDVGSSFMLQLQTVFADQACRVLLELFKATLEDLGTPPGRWAFIAWGDVARRCLLPYSSVNVAVLIDEAQPWLTSFWEPFRQAFSLKMAALGETSSPTLAKARAKLPGAGILFPPPNPDMSEAWMSSGRPGFQLGDRPGLSDPEAWPFAYCTPEAFAEEQRTDSSFLGDVTSACLITGAQSLFSRYLSAMRFALPPPIPILSRPGVSSQASSPVSLASLSSSGSAFGAEAMFGSAEQSLRLYALDMLYTSLETFDPEYHHEAVADSLTEKGGRLFHVTEELWRMPFNVLRGLCLYCGFRESDPFSMIRDLSSIGVLDHASDGVLSELFTSLLMLRVRMQSFYQSSQEVMIIHPDQVDKDMVLYRPPSSVSPSRVDSAAVYLSFDRAATSYQASKEDLLIIISLYKILLPLYRATRRFLASESSEPYSVSQMKHALPNSLKQFRQCPLYQDSWAVRGQAFNKLNLLEKAQECFLKGLLAAERPDVPSKIRDIPNRKKARQEPTDPKVLRKRLGTMPSMILRDLIHGISPKIDSDPLDSAELNLDKNLAVEELSTAEGVDFKEKGGYYTLLGILNTRLGRYKRSKRCFELAVKIDEYLFAQEGNTSTHTAAKMLSLATDFNHIGILHMCVGEFDFAIDYFEKSLKIIYQRRGDHTALISVLNNLGNCWFEVGEHKEAYEHYATSVHILERNRVMPSEPQPSSPQARHKLSKSTSDGFKGRKTIKDSSQIDLGKPENTGFCPQPLAMASTLHNMGVSCERLGKVEDAIMHHTQALNQYVKLFGARNYPYVARECCCLGALYGKIPDFISSKRHFQRGLDILRSHLGNDHPYTESVVGWMEQVKAAYTTV